MPMTPVIRPAIFIPFLPSLFMATIPRISPARDKIPPIQPVQNTRTNPTIPHDKLAIDKPLFLFHYINLLIKNNSHISITQNVVVIKGETLHF